MEGNEKELNKAESGAEAEASRESEREQRSSSKNVEASDELKHGVKNYLRNLFDIRGDMMSYGEIDEMMEENTVIHGSNMWVLIMAILIASIGLYCDSMVILIGAMLISPLMNGILTMGYSLAVHDLGMLKQAFKRFATQVVISLIASTLFFLVVRPDEPTGEMIARTSPTFWDVLIALFGGVAGIIGNTRKKKGNVIPGVAIATALMPPLCTVGYGIAMWKPQFIVGAFYLFIINTLLIGLSACIITNVLGIPNRVELDPKRQKKINGIVGVITVFVIVPSILTGVYTMYSSHIDNKISSYLENEFTFTNTQLVQSSVDKDNKVISVALVGMPISDETVEVLKGQLASYDLDDYTLNVAQNTLLDSGESSDKITIAVQENTIQELRDYIESQNARLAELEGKIASTADFEAVADKAEAVFGNYIEGCDCGVISDDGVEYFILAGYGRTEMSAEQKAIIENWLRVESGVDNVMIWIYSK